MQLQGCIFYSILSCNCNCNCKAYLDSLILGKMAEKISYLAVTSVLLVVLLLRLHHPANLCHAGDADLPKNSVNEGSGVGIQFMIKNSVCCCGRRNTFISGNTAVVAAATLALYGSTVAVFAYLSLKSLNFSWLQMSLLASTINPFSMDDFDECDHIMSRRWIRDRQSHQLECPGFGVLGSTDNYSFDMQQDFMHET